MKQDAHAHGPRYLMGIDSGLTITKAVVFSEDGHEIGSGSIPIQQRSPHPRWVERDMMEVWEGCLHVIRAALDDAGISGDQIAGIGATGHGDGIYLIDAHGEPVRAGILSLDTRAFRVVEEWRDSGVLDEALELTGQHPYAAAPAALLAWMKRHEPDSFTNTRWILSCKDWIRFQLTGVVATDPTEASVSFTNVRTQDYSPDACRLFGLESIVNKLPPIIGSSTIVGGIPAVVAEQTGLITGTPVVSGLHDVDAAAVGIGCTRPGLVSMTAGTFSINQVVSTEPKLDSRWACRNFVEPGRWMNMSISPASATNLEWFVRELCPAEVAQAEASNSSKYAFVNDEIEAVLDEKQDVYFLPFIFGSPHGDRASAAFFGLRGWHKRGHMLRAIYEGVAFNHKTHIDALRSAFDASEVRVTGGGARSEIWCRIFADAFGLPVVVATTQEAGALGTAMCAGIGAGIYTDLEHAVASTVQLGRTYQPDPQCQAALQASYQVYLSLIDALKPVWEHAD